MNYNKPGVYVEPISNVAPTTSIGTSCCAFIGITPKGEINKPVLVTSWSDFVNKFATGLETPFMKNSYLSHAVYGFFLNGGSRAYIVRILGTASAKASVTLMDTTSPTPASLFKLKAKEYGAWANSNLKIAIAENGVVADTYNISITCGNALVESFGNVSLDSTSDNYFESVITQKSSVVEIDSTITPTITEGTALATGTFAFTGGTDDISDSTITDSSYSGALNYLDSVKDVNILCVPGITTQVVHSAMLSYCAQKKSMFAILDLPASSTVDSVVALRPNITSDYGATYFPNIMITDPLTGALKSVPNCGHIAGVYARTDLSRGVYKAPAGSEAVIKGAISLSQALTSQDIGKLNGLDINCLTSEASQGILVWGARTLSEVPNTYVSDVRTDIYIYETCNHLSQFAVFEPNDDVLWSKLSTKISTFLREFWSLGGLKGTTPASAFYVKCDSENNPETSINSGIVNVEIGYAKKKPGEFIVLKFSQQSAE